MQSVSHVQLFAASWTAAHQASLSFIISWSLLTLMSFDDNLLFNNYSVGVLHGDFEGRYQVWKRMVFLVGIWLELPASILLLKTVLSIKCIVKAKILHMIYKTLHHLAPSSLTEKKL